VFENLPAEIVQAQPQRTETVEFRELLKAAFNEPLFYPPINQWLFPGDSLAIVLQSNLPNAAEVIKELVGFLKEMEINTDDIVVVVTSQMAEQFGITAQQQQQTESEIATGTPPAIIKVDIGDGEELSFQVHDPSNTYGLAYLAANEAGDPVHINRLLADADVVLPIGCPTPGDQQRYDCLYPDFGSADRLEQFKAGSGSVAGRTKEIELANDNLGTFFALQIVTAPGGQIADVVSGVRKDAFEHSKPANVSNGNGPIVVWTSIDQPVNRNTRKALLAQFDESISSKFSVRQRSLASIVSERPIFLRSALTQSKTEELGLGYVDSESDVLRVLAKFDSGVLLRDAHRCRIIHPSPTSN